MKKNKDAYIEKYMRMIQEAEDVEGALWDELIEGIINKIYEDGFEDGVNEGKTK